MAQSIVSQLLKLLAFVSLLGIFLFRISSSNYPQPLMQFVNLDTL
jgi:hypothetical protein